MTKTNLPYSSVAWNKDLGLVTDSSGKVGIPDISLIDSLVVESLGYEQKVFYRSEIPTTGHLLVKLKPRIIELPEVVVWKVKNLKEYGITVRKEGYTYFKNATCTNFQMAVKIIGYINPSKLESVSYYLSSSSQGSMPFRIRIYEINDQGLPGKDLLNENIIVHDYKKGNWNSFYLSEYNIEIPGIGFFVAMEWMCDDLDKKNGLCIAGTDKINSSLTYFKNGASKWRDFDSINKWSKPTNFLIKAKLGFPGK